MKVSNVNLPDGMQLDGYANATEWFSLITPVQVKIKAGTMSLLARKGVLDLTAIAIAPSGFLPDLSSVVVVAPDGSIVMSGHP